MTRALAILALCAGCALTAKSEPRELRYFSPPIAEADAVAGVPCGRIRLGRIVANDQLRLPIEHRVSAVELVPYDSLRWTERPDVFARRAITRAVYARPPVDGIPEAHRLPREPIRRPDGPDRSTARTSA